MKTEWCPDWCVIDHSEDDPNDPFLICSDMEDQ